jgi:hypothetical protein
VGISICDWGVYIIAGIHPLWAKSFPWAFFFPCQWAFLFSAGILYITVGISFLFVTVFVFYKNLLAFRL